ncbi:MAG: hypothetical protein HQL32_13265 [Planctomycetes bacterium]|nr:hypothetical protein [Planctomycetota bacterium]
MDDIPALLTEFTQLKYPFIPTLKLFKELKEERAERLNSSANKLKARTLLFGTSSLSLGCSPLHYRYYCLCQLLHLYARKFPIAYEGLSNIPNDGKIIFVMKHRSFSDITLHGFGYAWASSGLHLDQTIDQLKANIPLMKEILNKGQSCRFVMKEDLLNLPIGFHLVMNGGIPVHQDLETKAKNQKDFDPKCPKVLKKRDAMSKWFSFKDSYKEVMNELKGGGAIMIYGEATRVEGDQMGHLSEKFLSRLVRIPGAKIIPVGSRVENKKMIISYGPQCEIDDLRTQIATLSGIKESHFIS